MLNQWLMSVFPPLNLSDCFILIILLVFLVLLLVLLLSINRDQNLRRVPLQ